MCCFVTKSVTWEFHSECTISWWNFKDIAHGVPLQVFMWFPCNTFRCATIAKNDRARVRNYRKIYFAFSTILVGIPTV